jgi:hypothetical protein
MKLVTLGLELVVHTVRLVGHIGVDSRGRIGFSLAENVRGLGTS